MRASRAAAVSPPWRRCGVAVERTRSSTVAEHGPLIYRRTCSWETTGRRGLACACCDCCCRVVLYVVLCCVVLHATHSRSLGGNYTPSMLFHRIPSGARVAHADAPAPLPCGCVLCARRSAKTQSKCYSTSIISPAPVLLEKRRTHTRAWWRVAPRAALCALRDVGCGPSQLRG